MRIIRDNPQQLVVEDDHRIMVWIFGGIIILLGLYFILAPFGIVPSDFVDFGNVTPDSRNVYILGSGILCLVIGSVYVLSPSVTRLIFDARNLSISYQHSRFGRTQTSQHHWDQIYRLEIRMRKDSDGDREYALYALCHGAIPEIAVLHWGQSHKSVHTTATQLTDFLAQHGHNLSIIQESA